MKTNKYTYLKVIQQDYGQGWEDVSEYETNSSFVNTQKAHLVKYASGKYREEGEPLIKHDLREYKLLGYPTRVIKRKELN